MPRVEKLFDFGHAVGPWDTRGALGTLDLGEEQMDVTLEQTAKESAQGIDGNIDSGGSELTLGDEMKEPAFDLRGVELIGRLAVELGQGVDEADVGMDGALGFFVEREILNEFLA